MLETFTCETFRPLVGTAFRFTVGGHEAVETVLTEAVEYPVDPIAGKRTPFSVVFQGPLEPFLPQGMYGVEHPDLGAFDLFVVPLGPEDGRMRYEAVFT